MKNKTDHHEMGNDILENDITLYTVLLTPELAQNLVDNQRRNRNIKRFTLSRYENQLRRGRWFQTGETIKIDKEGRMVDGQHRCCAVINTGISIPAAVASGLDDDAVYFIDIGTKRTGGDVLTMSGHKNANNKAAALKWLFFYRNGLMERTTNPAVCPDHGDILGLAESVEMDYAMQIGNNAKSILVPSICAFAAYVFYDLDNYDADCFFNFLIDGVGLERGSPVLMLRNRLIADKANKAKLPQIEKAALVFKAWNAYRKKVQIQQSLRWRREGPSKERFPRAI